MLVLHVRFPAGFRGRTDCLDLGSSEWGVVRLCSGDNHSSNGLPSDECCSTAAGQEWDNWVLVTNLGK